MTSPEYHRRALRAAAFPAVAPQPSGGHHRARPLGHFLGHRTAVLGKVAKLAKLDRVRGCDNVALYKDTRPSKLRLASS
jgi:hypothetical protein